MPEIPDVVTLTTISSTWANLIRSRTVMRYSSVANRTTEHPSPTAGDLSFLEDSNDVDFFDGSAWRHVGPPTGAIEMFGGTSAPVGWLLCDGTAVSRTTYAGLFDVVGITYGPGNGTSTFNLPDLRQRFPLGKAASGTGAALGSAGGNIDHTHTGPSHVHSNPNTNESTAHLHTGTTGIESASSGRTIGEPDALTAGVNHTHGFTTGADGIHTHVQTPTSPSGTAATGGANPPYLTVNFIVKT